MGEATLTLYSHTTTRESISLPNRGNFTQLIPSTNATLRRIMQVGAKNRYTAVVGYAFFLSWWRSMSIFSHGNDEGRKCVVEWPNGLRTWSWTVHALKSCMLCNSVSRRAKKSRQNRLSSSVCTALHPLLHLSRGRSETHTHRHTA